MQPYDYTSQLQVPSVTDSYLKGVNVGIAQDNAMLAQQQKQMAIQAAQQEQQRQQFLMDFTRKENPSGSDYAKLILLDPKNSEAIKRSFDAASTGQKEAAFSQGSELFGAINSGNQEVAKNLLDTRIQAAQNAGDEVTAKQLGVLKGVYEQSPQQAKLMVASLLHGIDSDRATKVIDSSNKLALAPIEQRTQEAKATQAESEAEVAKQTIQTKIDQAKTELQKAGWDVRNLQSQINDRSARLGLEKQRLALDTTEKLGHLQVALNKVDPETKKLVNDSVVSAVASKQSADQFNSLADRLQNLDAWSGAAGSASEWLKKVGGMQNGITGLRQEYIRLRQGAVSKSLPPGPASDKDIQLALSGFPSDTADPQLMASFLRGMGKLQDVQAAVDNAKSEWLAKNNGQLTRATSTFIAGDYTARPGETFKDFSDRIVKDVSGKYEPKKPSYMNIPGHSVEVSTPVNDVRAQADAILGRK